MAEELENCLKFKRKSFSLFQNMNFLLIKAPSYGFKNYDERDVYKHEVTLKSTVFTAHCITGIFFFINHFFLKKNCFLPVNKHPAY